MIFHLDSMRVRQIFSPCISTQAQKDDLQDRTIKRYKIPDEEPMMAVEDVPTTYKNKVA